MVTIINKLVPSGIQQQVQGNDGAYLFTVYPQVTAGMAVTTGQHIGYLSFQGIQVAGVSSPCHGVLQTLTPGAAKNGTMLAFYTAAAPAPTV